jgi:hypothetical protein
MSCSIPQRVAVIDKHESLARFIWQASPCKFTGPSFPASKGKSGGGMGIIV